MKTLKILAVSILASLSFAIPAFASSGFTVSPSLSHTVQAYTFTCGNSSEQFGWVDNAPLQSNHNFSCASPIVFTPILNHAYSFYINTAPHINCYSGLACPFFSDFSRAQSFAPAPVTHTGIAIMNHTTATDLTAGVSNSTSETMKGLSYPLYIVAGIILAFVLINYITRLMKDIDDKKKRKVFKDDLGKGMDTKDAFRDAYGNAYGELEDKK